MNSGPKSPAYQHLDYKQVSGALGIEISGLQLNGTLGAEVVAELKQALLDFKVLFFRDQNMGEQEHADFVRLVGVPVDADFIPPIKGFPMITRQQYDEYSRMGSDINFHHDDSFHKYPTKMSILRGVVMPSCGGDTVWVNMEKVYNSLSEPLKNMLEGMTAEHSLARSFSQTVLEEKGGAKFDKMIERNPPHIHPLIIRHPDTGKKCIYASELLTARILELDKEESDLLLDYICQKAYRPEFECRFRWENNSVAWWDNRNTVHRGIDDFFPAVRVMQRIAIADEQRPALYPDREPKRDIAHLDIVPCNSLDDEDDTTTTPGNARQPGEVDLEFLAELNQKKDGITFTPRAAVRIKSIPVTFQGAALSAVFSTAEETGVTTIDDEILDVVQAKR